MSFERPYFLLTLLLIAAAAGIWVWAERRRMRYAVRYTNVDVLATVVGGRAWSRYVGPILFGLSLAVLFVALARPEVNRMVASERATVILVLDTSRSMQSRDVKPTRLGAAQEAVHSFLDRVPDRLRVGFVVFAGEAQVATPPTTDHELVREAVDGADGFLIYGGTAIGDALEAAVELGRRALEQNPDSEGEIAAPDLSRSARTLAAATEDEPQHLVSILFLSDGAQTRGILQPLEGAELAKDAGIPVYTIALGTPNGTVTRGGFGFGPSTPGQPSRIRVPPDPVTLRLIAETTGGEFSEARTAESLEGAYEELGSSLGREPGQSEITFILLAVAAVLLVAASVVGVLLAQRLP
jgi:Ca-activated chloride channel homolog